DTVRNNKTSISFFSSFFGFKSALKRDTSTSLGMTVNHHKPVSMLGFTLIELIVVITILVILGTIAFLNLGGFQSSARDGRRVSDMANIGKALDMMIVTQGNAPIPTSAVSYTGGSVTLFIGTVTSTTIPRMNGDFSDPLTRSPYNYSVFGNGLYYQLGIDFENPLSYHTSIPGIDTVYAADSSLRYSKLSGNYVFDPSLPSLFVLSGSYNTASGGIFAPDVCFVLDNVSTNTFGSSVSSVTSSGCIAKKDMSLNTLDRSLVGYWDMETLTSSGLLKDLSGNGNEGVLSGSVLPTSTGGYVGKGYYFSGSSMFYSSQSLKYQGSQTITLEMLVNLKALASSSILIESSQDANTNTGSWYLADFYPSGGCNSKIPTITPFLSISPIGWRRIIKCPYVQSEEKNKFISIIYDLKKQNISIFLNGSPLRTYEAINNPVSGSINSETIKDYTLYIGKRSNAPGGGALGIIDDLKIYNRALSDSEIKQQARIAGF
ncbi:MAG: prepilin-type N-terminal cleavage/methylation domain-containing protein, partial [Candidatus Gracilibacteria bacterium]|nr:prepilin-type N-terminal cleavage/methylation domain-containing protein [Candidatus Gracilibacteria bacterium]